MLAQGMSEAYANSDDFPWEKPVKHIRLGVSDSHADPDGAFGSGFVPRNAVRARTSFLKIFCKATGN